MLPKKIYEGERVTVRYCRTEKFKAGLISVSLVLPIRRERTYLTSLLMSVLLRGTQKYPSISQLNKRLDYLYGIELSGRNFYRGDAHIIGLAAEMVDDAYLPTGEAHESLLSGALEVIGEILFHPVLDANGCLDARYVESEKQLQCDTINAQKNQPQTYAATRFHAHMHENEPCGVPIYGTKEDVMRVTPEELTAHWRELCREMHLHCFYLGSAEEDTLRNAIAQAFDGEFASGEASSVPSVRTGAQPLRETQRFEESLPVMQGQLIMGFRTGVCIGDADFYACTLFNELLGMSPVSKLFMNVRERLSLCYSCQSMYNIYKGTLTVACGLENENREQAEAEVLRQIGAIADGEITDEEWTAAQKSLENAYRQLEDSPAALEGFYFGRALAGEKVSLAECRAHLASVAREDVIRVARGMHLDTVFYLRHTGSGEVEEDDED